MACYIMDPLVTIYDKIEELGHLSHTGQNLYSMPQLVKYGSTIIKNIYDFETDICTWIVRPVVNHMWLIFKTHFKEAHRVLRAV